MRSRGALLGFVLINKHENETMQTTSIQQFPTLETVTRPAVDTAAAAFYLSRQPQTLRGWASSEGGPLRPNRIHGRLSWPVAELRRVLGVSK